MFECSIQCLDAELLRLTWIKYQVFQRGASPMKYLVMWGLEDAMSVCFRDCVCMCVCVEGWLYTWLKGNIVAVESLLFLRDSFLYTKQSRDKQVLNRQEATKKPTKHAGIQEHTSRVEGHHRHYGKLKSICSMTWKSNWLLEQLLCQQTLICCFDFISWFLT